MIRIALADDHQLIRKSICTMLESAGMNVVADTDNGRDLLEVLSQASADVILMDINMPLMDGIETTQRLIASGNSARIIALSMFDDDLHVIRMIRAGARAYVLKNAPPEELIRAIHDVHEKGYHFSDLVSGRLIKSLQEPDPSSLPSPAALNDRETEFLKHCCSEMTYKEIGAAMYVSPRTAEGYGKSLCEKLGLRSRVGLVLYAIKHNVFNP